MVGGSLRQLSTFVQSWTCLSQAECTLGAAAPSKCCMQ